MRLQQKSLSRLTLESLLRKKRTNLENFLKDTGIVAYDTLVNRCNSIGVLPPEREDFLKAMGNPLIHEYSSPTEGIIVLNPQEEIETSKNIEVLSEEDASVSENPKKKKKKSSHDQ
jgi:hypothetical protein